MNFTANILTTDGRVLEKIDSQAAHFNVFQVLFTVLKDFPITNLVHDKSGKDQDYRFKAKMKGKPVLVVVSTSVKKTPDVLNKLKKEFPDRKLMVESTVDYDIKPFVEILNSVSPKSVISEAEDKFNLRPLEDFVSKLTGHPIKFAKIEKNNSYKKGGTAYFTVLASDNIAPKMNIKMFSGLRVYSNQSYINDDGSLIIRLNYRWTHFGGNGSNGTDICIVELDPSTGKIISSRDELK